MKRLGIFLMTTLCAGVLFIGACGDEEHALPEVDCNAGVVPTYGEVALLNSCIACHSSALQAGARNGAPGGIDYDTYDGAAANAEHGAAEVYEGKMPPGGGNLPAADTEAFYSWALCGTPQ